jgi:hypothetical protein
VLWLFKDGSNVGKNTSWLQLSGLATRASRPVTEALAQIDQTADNVHPVSLRQSSETRAHCSFAFVCAA